MIRNVLLGGAFLLGNIAAWAQNTEGPTLVVRADDMGAFHSVNKACIAAFRDGIEQSVEVMAVTPWFPEAVKMLEANPTLDVGLHLVITSEWENVKWRPLTHCPSITDENGYYIMQGITGGDYDVTVNYLGYEPLSTSVSLPERGTTEKNLVLSELTTLQEVVVLYIQMIMI